MNTDQEMARCVPCPRCPAAEYEDCWSGAYRFRAPHVVRVKAWQERVRIMAARYGSKAQG